MQILGLGLLKCFKGFKRLLIWHFSLKNVILKVFQLGIRSKNCNGALGQGILVVKTCWKRQNSAATGTFEFGINQFAVADLECSKREDVKTQFSSGGVRRRGRGV